MTDYDKGYIDGLEFALKQMKFEPHHLDACTVAMVEMETLNNMKAIREEIAKVKGGE